MHSVWRWVPNADLGFHVSAALLGGAAPLLSTVQLSPSLQQGEAVVPSCWVCSSPRAAELRSCYQLSNALSMLRVKAAAIAPV